MVLPRARCGFLPYFGSFPRCVLLCGTRTLSKLPVHSRAICLPEVHLSSSSFLSIFLFNSAAPQSKPNSAAGPVLRPVSSRSAAGHDSDEQGVTRLTKSATGPIVSTSTAIIGQQLGRWWASIARHERTGISGAYRQRELDNTHGRTIIQWSHHGGAARLKSRSSGRIEHVLLALNTDRM